MAPSLVDLIFISDDNLKITISNNANCYLISNVFESPLKNPEINTKSVSSDFQSRNHLKIILIIYSFF